MYEYHLSLALDLRTLAHIAAVAGLIAIARHHRMQARQHIRCARLARPTVGGR